jgi:hypothetical protein
LHRKTQIEEFSCFKSVKICVNPWLKSFLLSLPLSLASCANHHFRVPAEGPPSNAPRYVELQEEKQIATLHFPAGAYSFYAEDDVGYYYRAPRQVVEHSGRRSVAHQGGLYLDKRNPKKLRGYIYLAGGLTHVGDLSRVKHEPRD